MIGPGSQIGRFRVLELLGEGGMGTVFSALDPAIERRVAIKVLKSAHRQGSRALTRFLNEARAANRVAHEHIVEITEILQAESGEACYVMELLQGESVARRLKRIGRFPLGQAVHVVRQVAAALEVAHRRGVVHRDLKPDNVFLIDRGGDPDYAKLLDFGIAKLGAVDSTPGSDAPEKPLTQSGALLGTVLYMSPEACLGSKAGVDHRTDIYSLGVMLFEMITGRPPFLSDGLGPILLAHINDPFPSLRGVLPGISDSFEQVLIRAARKNPAERWPTMEAFSDALRPYETTISSRSEIVPSAAPAAPVPPTASLADPFTATGLPSRASAPSGEVIARMQAQRRTRTVVAVAFVLTVGAVGVAWKLRAIPAPASSLADPTPAMAVTPPPTTDAAAAIGSDVSSDLAGAAPREVALPAPRPTQPARGARPKRARADSPAASAERPEEKPITPPAPAAPKMPLRLKVLE